MKIIKIVNTIFWLMITVLVLLTLVIDLAFTNKSLNSSIKELERSVTAEPSVSISRLKIDSVDSAGNVYGTEIHAGEIGSSDSYYSRVVLPPNNESQYWARYPHQIPKEEVYVLRVETWGKQGRRWTELITPSW